MCGIVGIIGVEPVAPRMVEALRRLEYRGYDSAGVATLERGAIARRRAEGKLGNLATKLGIEPLDGMIGIGHTRWATHGAPTEGNAHPHATDKVAVVHNGIIENFRELLADLAKDGYTPKTQTDTESVALWVTREIDRGLDPEMAVAVDAQEAARRLRARLHVQGPGEAADRRPPRRAARRRLRRHRDVSRLRRHGARAVHLAAELSARRRLGGADAQGRHDPRRFRRHRAARDAGVAGLGADGRQGQPPPFHGQGNLRAARDHLAHAQPLRGHGCRDGRAARDAAVRFRDAQPADDLGLRHGVPRRR